MLINFQLYQCHAQLNFPSLLYQICQTSKKIHIHYIFVDHSQLNLFSKVIQMDKMGNIKKMHQLAMQSRSKAYCPYSGFAVGSTVLGGNGKYYTGCNVEKAVGTLCAQGTAIVKMVEDGCRQILEVYVVTQLTGDMIAAPCGICRQYIKQFSDNDQKLQIHLGSAQKGHETTITLSKLFPMSFGPKSLGFPSAKDQK